jgi:photosystem II stability/assembly factor-like uncharacterized protein
MSVLAPPPQDELELLIREARARQRRRRIMLAAGIAVVAGLGLALWAAIPSRSTAQRNGADSNAIGVRKGVAAGPRARIASMGTSGGVTWATNYLWGRSAWVTVDGGRTWRRLANAPSRGSWLVDATFADPSHGWAQADGNRHSGLLSTTDGGRSWRPLVIRGRVIDGGAIFFSSPRSGYLVVDSSAGATLLRSHDGGASWQRVSREPFQINVAAVRGRELWAIGWPTRAPDSGRLYRSGDGGRTWHHVRLPGQYDSVRDVSVFGRSVVVATNYGPQGILGVYVSSDGGAHWKLRIGHSAMTMGVPDFMFSAVSATTWFAAAGGLYETTNAGRSWHLVFASRQARVSPEIDFTSPRAGWAIFGDDELMRTTDGGRHWVPAGPRLPGRSHR